MNTSRAGEAMMPDGIVLRADIHRPEGLEKTPTILVRIPFNNSLKNRLRSDAIGRFWAARGYTVVVQGTRGRYRSDGDFYPAVNERDDGLATLAWLKTQPWYDGRLAMWGGSAFGHTQWAISDQAEIDAFAVQIASSSYEKTFWPGGAFALESALYWALVSPPEKDRQTTSEEIQQGAEGWPVVEADDRALQDVPFFNDWAQNGSGSPYWQRTDGIERADNVDAPILLLGGWFDPFLPTMLEDFASLQRSTSEAARKSRMIIGPYTHAGEIAWPGHEPIDAPYRKDSVEPVLDWFDQHLNVHETNRSFAPLRIFVMGTNIWRDEDSWPLARAVPTRFHFHPNGSLSKEGLASSSQVGFTYDPEAPVPTSGGAMLGPRSGIKQQAEPGGRDDVLSFVSEPLAQPLEATGPLTAELWVETSAPSTDFTVKLIDVYPDGKAFNVSDGILRRTYSPGEPIEVKVELDPTAYVFLEGHRLRVDISSSNFPRFDRNPNTGEDAATAQITRLAQQSLLLSPERPSVIVLPVIPQ
ncbi:MAG: CocE/NonD family hydrolase [Verrucomicrobiota bacterium]